MKYETGEPYFFLVCLLFHRINRPELCPTLTCRGVLAMGIPLRVRRAPQLSEVDAPAAPWTIAGLSEVWCTAASKPSAFQRFGGPRHAPMAAQQALSGTRIAAFLW